jgi:SHS2 domain-containing protein
MQTVGTHRYDVSGLKKKQHMGFYLTQKQIATLVVTQLQHVLVLFATY